MLRKTGMALLLLSTALAGCSDTPSDAVEADLFPFEVYRFTWDGTDVWVPGTEHGWLVRVHNPTDRSLRATLIPSGVEEALVGPVADGERAMWLPSRIEAGVPQGSTPLFLDPGAAGVFLVKVSDYTGDGTPPTSEAGFRILATLADDPTHPFATYQTSWEVTRVDAADPVLPGDHVQTVTVGVWINGTSFYTNSAASAADPAFPAGFDRNDTDGTPLPVYVYDNDRDEQPEGSKDTCHFTTIAGYNALLKEQALGSTGVRFLAPEAAYTRDGNEDHPLYGDALVFLNQVVAHDGATTQTDALPDPTGACFAGRLDGLPVS